MKIIWNNRSGFTLSEILITLGIIGVVAALTIPSVIASQQEQATITNLKKAHSTLSNAFTLAVQANGTPDSWGLTGNDATSQKIIINNFIPYLSVAENCVDQTGSTTLAATPGCAPNVMYKLLNGTSYANYYNYGGGALRPKIRLKDGMSFIFEDVVSTACGFSTGTSKMLQSTCSEIMVDINGNANPNTVGKDFFWFKMTKYGIVPMGTTEDTNYLFANDCRDKNTMTGFACTAWILYNENMDYLKCNDLAWGTKNKCS